MNRLRLLQPLLRRTLVATVGGFCLAALATKASAVVTRSHGAGMATVLDLQKNSIEETSARAKLVNLNPGINVWYLLEVPAPSGKTLSYNLWNPDPDNQTLHLDKNVFGALLIESLDGATSNCQLWTDQGSGALAVARRQKRPFWPLCDGKVHLKSAAEGHQSFNEWCSDVLRQYLPGGERVITFVKNRLLQDHELITASVQAPAFDKSAASPRRAPIPALMAAAYKGVRLAKGQLGLKIDSKGAAMAAGRWYPSSLENGVYVSQIEPSFVATEILSTFSERAGSMQSVEEKAVAYLVAFDMKDFNLGYATGTKHPSVEWSKRSPFARLAGMKGGPDGFSTVRPLVTNGTVSPSLLSRTIATFTGGFKRYHSAFKAGPFSHANNGSHYGFVEDGVVLSVPNSGLSTLIVRADGGVEMKTWTPSDNTRLSSIRYARQNGVALVVPLDAVADAAIQKKTKLVSKPGIYVNQWGKGNWSGDMRSHKRTLRTGACLQTVDGSPYLVFGYFSAATPTSMARVFQAYGCDYAMHLDMNLPEHGYMSLFHRDGPDYKVEHLTTAMAAFDQQENGKILPRFIAVPDNRDFFFVYKKDAEKQAATYSSTSEKASD